MEKDLNLPIALKTRDMLTLYGFTVVMTRESDVSTCDEGIEGIANKKTSDILNRFDMIEQYPNAIFLSIHQNKYPEASSHGAQMFYGPKSEQSQRLGEILQRNFAGMLQPDNERQIKPADESVYLLYHSPVPSVLIECGFLSNPQDEAQLRDDSFQNKIAFVITASLMQYMQEGYYPQMDMAQEGQAPADLADL